MRSWDPVQPFLGIDAIEAIGPVEPDRLRAAAAEELALLGVAYPSTDGRTVTYRSGPPAVAVECAPAGRTPLEALAEHCSAELNRRFGPEEPIARFWVIRSAPAVIGMTWQHWPIDGASAAALFRRVLARFAGAPVTDPAATELVAPPPSALAPPWRGWQRIRVELAESLREVFAYSRLYPVPRPRPERTALRVRLLELPHPPRPPGATLNDVVAAALLWALAEVLPGRYGNAWRQRLALVNIVDLRPHGGDACARAWGQFLGHAVLHMPEPRPAKLGALVEAVRTQSLRSREGKFFFASLGAYRLVRTALRVLPRRWGWTLPYALTPFTAALTNTRFRAEWNVPPFAGRFGRSWRVAPLGGFVPLTADVCSKGDRVSLALTYEEGGVIGGKIEQIEQIMAALLTGRIA